MKFIFSTMVLYTSVYSGNMDGTKTMSFELKKQGHMDNNKLKL